MCNDTREAIWKKLGYKVKGSVSQGTIGSFSYPFPGHLDAAAPWLGNATSADQEGMYA